MSDELSITFHGAAGTVTGSCMEFIHGGKRLLVDCGLFQGSRTLETLNRNPFAFVPKHVDAVILSHAHIDHSGLLPRLVAEGFDGDIWCTAPTSDLLEFMLADGGRIQESDAARRNRRRDRAGQPPFEPLYNRTASRPGDRPSLSISKNGSSRSRGFGPGSGTRDIFWDRHRSNWRSAASIFCARATLAPSTRLSTPTRRARPVSTMSFARPPTAIANAII